MPTNSRDNHNITQRWQHDMHSRNNSITTTIPLDTEPANNASREDKQHAVTRNNALSMPPPASTVASNEYHHKQTNCPSSSMHDSTNTDDIDQEARWRSIAYASHMPSSYSPPFNQVNMILVWSPLKLTRVWVHLHPLILLTPSPTWIMMNMDDKEWANTSLMPAPCHHTTTPTNTTKTLTTPATWVKPWTHHNQPTPA